MKIIKIAGIETDQLSAAYRNLTLLETQYQRAKTVADRTYLPQIVALRQNVAGLVQKIQELYANENQNTNNQVIQPNTQQTAPPAGGVPGTPGVGTGTTAG